MRKEKAISRLRSMLSWSDRIGSDEVYEIVCIMNLLEGKKRFNEENIIKQWRER